MKHVCSLPGIVVIAACSQHNVTTNTTKAGPTQVFLIDAPFPYDQVARVDVYIVRVAASTKPDTAGNASDSLQTGLRTITAPHRPYNLLELGNGAAAKLGEGIVLPGQYVQFLITMDADSSSITLKDGTVLTNRTSPGIDWGGYPSRFSFGLFTDPPIQIADSGAVVIIDFDLGRSFYARDPANAAAGFNYVGYMQVRNSALTGSVSGTVMGQNDGAIADASIALLVVNPNYPTDEATWGVLGTARSDATGRFRLPYASPGSYVLAVDAPATSVYGGLRLPNVSVSTGAETQTGPLIVPHKGGGDVRTGRASAALGLCRGSLGLFFTPATDFSEAHACSQETRLARSARRAGVVRRGRRLPFRGDRRSGGRVSRLERRPGAGTHAGPRRVSHPGILSHHRLPPRLDPCCDHRRRGIGLPQQLRRRCH